MRCRLSLVARASIRSQPSLLETIACCSRQGLTWSAGATADTVSFHCLIVLTVNQTFIKLYWREHWREQQASMSLQDHQLRTLQTVRLLISLADTCTGGAQKDLPPVRCSRCLEAREAVPIGQSAQHVKVTISQGYHRPPIVAVAGSALQPLACCLPRLAQLSIAHHGPGLLFDAD